MAPTTEASKSEQLESAQRLRTLFGRVSRSLRPTETGTAKELTPTRTSVLLAADRHGPIRLAEIAEREGLNPTLLSRTVARLVDAGLIERTADASDRRSAWVSATTAGRTAASGIRRDRTLQVNDALERLDDHDREMILEALPSLERLVDSLRSNADEDPVTGRRA
jgi:DNA-binding MarR family transcriptional regulator